tara:strand:- start:893 stop:1561 length:669 start_codon:yes stop_codon:yes gene_type:complete
MERPCIGVTGNAKRLSFSWWCIRLSLWLAGARAVRISVKHAIDRKQLDGLVISGGDDIHPSIYGDEPMPKATYDPARDQLEMDYIGFAAREGIPVLGICRGYQLMNTYFGGTLYADIRKKRRATSNWGTILPRKTALLVDKTRLKDIIGRSPEKINSLHHQAIDKLAPCFDATAHDLDDFIQGIERNDDGSMLGVQWHPEYLFYLDNHRKLFRWLVGQARKR